MSSSSPFVFLFVDGVGLRGAASDNPFSRYETPELSTVLGGSLTLESVQETESLLLKGLDASLDVEGLPQSATGQTALFTGVNGAEIVGRHVTAYPGPRLREVLEQGSILLRLKRAGRSVTFANAFSERYFELLETRRLRRSASVCAVEAAQLRLRGLEELRLGRAVSWDIRRDLFAARLEGAFEPLEPIASHDAGRHLGELAREHDFVLFETFLTDLVGHGRGSTTEEETVRRLDGLWGGLIESLGDAGTVLLTSDHGNFEDRSHDRHTHNPVPLLVHGRHARSFADLRSILEVTPRIVELFCASE